MILSLIDGLPSVLKDICQHATHVSDLLPYLKASPSTKLMGGIQFILSVIDLRKAPQVGISDLFMKLAGVKIEFSLQSYL